MLTIAIKQLLYFLTKNVKSLIDKPHIMMIRPKECPKENGAEKQPKHTNIKLPGFPKGNILL
jgi:hypothetical protein